MENFENTYIFLIQFFYNNFLVFFIVVYQFGVHLFQKKTFETFSTAMRLPYKYTYFVLTSIYQVQYSHFLFINIVRGLNHP